MKLQELLEQRVATVKLIETKEAELKDLNKQLQTLDEAVMVKFDNEGQSSAKVPGLGTFSARQQFYYSILPERREIAMAKFKEEFPEMVKETINGNTLSAFMREAKKTGQELPPEIKDSMKETERRFLVWRR